MTDITPRPAGLLRFIRRRRFTWTEALSTIVTQAFNLGADTVAIAPSANALRIEAPGAVCDDRACCRKLVTLGFGPDSHGEACFRIGDAVDVVSVQSGVKWHIYAPWGSAKDWCPDVDDEEPTQEPSHTIVTISQLIRVVPAMPQLFKALAKLFTVRMQEGTIIAEKR